MTLEHREVSVPQPIPSLQELVEMGKKKFDSTESYDPTTIDHPMHGQVREGYSSFMAGQDLVDDLVNQGIGVAMLAGCLIQQTSIDISEVTWEFVFEWDEKLHARKDWTEAMHSLAGQIIKLEVEKKYPEIITEEKRRDNIYNPL